jgi:hypothetical protein
MLSLVLDHIVLLRAGMLTAWAVAAMLVLLAHDSPHFAKYIIEEDDIRLLVRLLKDGIDVTREAAVTMLELLARDEESVEKLLPFKVCSILAIALKEPPLRVQAAATEESRQELMAMCRLGITAAWLGLMVQSQG